MDTGIPENIDVIDGRSRNYDLFYAILFSVNWISYGFALAYSGNAGFVFQRMGLLSPTETAIYGSVLAIGGLFGSLITGLFLHKYMSYKYSTLISGILGIIGWYVHFLIFPIDQAQPDQILTILLIGRFIVGVSVGISASSVPVCVTLSVHSANRYHAGLYPSIFLAVGYFFSFLIGFWLIKSDTSIIPDFSHSSYPLHSTLLYSPSFGILFSLLGTVCTIIFPNSVLHRTLSDTSFESGYDPLILQERQNVFEGIPCMFNLFRSGHVSRQLFIGVGLLFFQQMMGINAVIFNAISILSHFFGDKESDPSVPSLAGLVIGVVYVICAILILAFSKFCKRNVVLCCGSFLICFSHGFLALVYYLRNVDAKIGVGLILLFLLAFCCTWGPFPWMIVSEIFPNNFRTCGITLSTVVFWLSMFFVSIFYALLCNTAYLYIVFGVFSLMSFLSFLFVMCCVPETKDFTLQEIQNNFLET